jgi:peroxiredoxin Q/BCP
MSKFEKLGFQVFGISTQSVESHRKFALALKLNFPILADVGGKVANKYGVLRPNGLAERVTFVIDANGVITAIDRQVKVKTHGADLCALIQRPTK